MVGMDYNGVWGQLSKESSLPITGYHLEASRCSEGIFCAYPTSLASAVPTYPGMPSSKLLLQIHLRDLKSQQPSFHV